MTLPIKTPELAIINMDTGEIVPFDQLVVPGQQRWDKVYPKNLARMMDMFGDEKMKVVAHLIRKKDTMNMIAATMREIAESTGVSLTTVNKVLKIMQQKDFIRKLRGGKWILSPRVICGGKQSIGMATINYYDNVD